MQVPKLRFKEFTGEWKFYKIKDISTEIKRKTTNTNYEVLTISANKGFISQKERFSKVIAGNSLEKYNLLKRNEISYNKGASKSFKYGCVYVQKDFDYALVPNVYISFSINTNNSYFYEKLFENHYLDKFLRVLITSTARQDGLLNIDRKDFFNIKVPVPSLEEQTKIADFLSLIDEKIELQQKLVDNLNLYKKGLLQKVFSNNSGWKSAKLGKYIIQLSNRNRNNIDYYVLSVSNSKGFIKQTEQFNDRELASENKSNYKIVHKYEFAYNPARINVGSIAMLENFEHGIVSPMYVCFKCNDIYHSFLKYFFLTNEFKNQMKVRLEGSVRMCLSYEALSNIDIKIPSIEEQNRIADLFTNLDKKIDFETNKLNNLKEYKKGLLQQMFI